MKLKSDDVEYLNGYLSAFDEFPDGAWGQACVDAIESCQRFKGKNPHDVWLAWIAETSERKS